MSTIHTRVTDLIEVEGRNEHLEIWGASGPAVVFEPAIGDVGLTWGLVMPGVAEFAQAVTHDRPGLGASEPSPLRRTAFVMADELRLLLERAAIDPPYVMVGHSFGSLVSRAFAYRYREDVAGLVMVDSAHEDQMDRFPDEIDPAGMLHSQITHLRALAEQARTGAEIPPLMVPPAAFPAEIAAAYREATRPTAVRLETHAAELAGLDESHEQLRGLREGGLGDLPLVAIRHGIPQPLTGMSDAVNSRYEKVWQELQEDLAAHSKSGKVMVAERAGHNIHHDRPDLVIETVRTVVKVS
ncbi:MAG TPA: alpha/beta hydrolase [Acidimicrobiia bacterium]|nr:alpha/beta hydrolase [Acidimicrobiia bacterium]